MKIIIFLCLISNISLAAGVTSHRFMSKKSLDYIRDKEIKSMLQRNFKTFLAATMVPDMGYFSPESRWWGEEVHWGGFLNWLWGYNNNRCKAKGWPPKNSGECETLWTIYFGILSHSIGDIQWHGGYIFRFSVMEHGAGLGTAEFNQAHTIADNMGDLPAVHHHLEKSLNGSIDFNILSDILNEYAKFKKRPSINKNFLILTFTLQEAWYFGIKIAWPLYYYFKLTYKWGHDNYFGTLGGIDNNARRLAELIDMISWENQRLNLTFAPEIDHREGKAWPFESFFISRADKSQRVNKSYHEPGYQLQPVGTYDCRYGLYLGGWRLYSYGSVSRCPYKATADYKNAQCERYRFWPLKCKNY